MITVPIYYTQEFKTKDNKTFLVGMNWYRNAVHFLSNKVKQHYHSTIKSQVQNLSFPDKFTLDIKVFYKNSNCDGSNISSLMEKYVLDALQENNVIVNDNVKYHMGTTWSIGGEDKHNPRCEISIKSL